MIEFELYERTQYTNAVRVTKENAVAVAQFIGGTVQFTKTGEVATLLNSASRSINLGGKTYVDPSGDVVNLDGWASTGIPGVDY